MKEMVRCIFGPRLRSPGNKYQHIIILFGRSVGRNFERIFSAVSLQIIRLTS
jgi:hypothetical protein